MTAAQLASIRKKTELLGGEALGDEGDALVEMAAQRACALCGRTDLPEEMEQAVAALAADMAAGGSVKSLKRGDTSLTFASSGGQDALVLLSPFRRLGTPREEA